MTVEKPNHLYSYKLVADTRLYPETYQWVSRVAKYHRITMSDAVSMIVAMSYRQHNPKEGEFTNDPLHKVTKKYGGRIR